MEALRGRVTPHHRFLLGQHFGLIEQLERREEEFDEQMERVIQPFLTSWSD